MSWFYERGGQQAIFSGSEDATPEGWTSEPQFNPLDHHRNGRPGGSVTGPRVKARGRLERKAR